MPEDSDGTAELGGAAYAFAEMRGEDTTHRMRVPQTPQPEGVPGWEGTIGPFRHQYGSPHVYARDVHSGAGNCVCGRALGDRLHVQAAPGVPVPDEKRLPW